MNATLLLPRRLAACLILTVLLPAQIFAYGPTGHQLVGAIAEARLKQTPEGRAALQRALALLSDPADPGHHGLSLRQAGPMPDELRTWDDLIQQQHVTPAQMLTRWPKVEDVPAVEDEYPPGTVKMVKVGEIWPQAVRQQMWEYFAANCAPDDFDPKQPRHHVFHFCDISVAPGADLSYDVTKRGCSPHDIVHAINYCAAVLAGQTPSPAPGPKMTKSVALVLLVHLLGDLHQPLHVGAEYFNASGAVVDPAHAATAFGDRGGNQIAYYGKKFHGEWDSTFVTEAVGHWATLYHLGDHPDLDALANTLATGGDAPAGTDITVLVKQWAEESVRLSQEAHTRLNFPPASFQLASSGDEMKTINGEVIGDRPVYTKWAAEQVQTEIVRAGLRLAWVIEHYVR